MYNDTRELGTRCADWRQTYSFGLEFGDFMACAFDKNVCPVALLMHDAGEIARIVKPRSGWSARKALNVANGCILQMI